MAWWALVQVLSDLFGFLHCLPPRSQALETCMKIKEKCHNIKGKATRGEISLVSRKSLAPRACVHVCSTDVSINAGRQSCIDSYVIHLTHLECRTRKKHTRRKTRNKWMSLGGRSARICHMSPEVGDSSPKGRRPEENLMASKQSIYHPFTLARGG